MTHLNESYVILFLSKVSVLHDVEIIIFKFKQYSFAKRDNPILYTLWNRCSFF